LHGQENVKTLTILQVSVSISAQEKRIICQESVKKNWEKRLAPVFFAE
jgi:hypothetical protein